MIHVHAVMRDHYRLDKPEVYKLFYTRAQAIAWIEGRKVNACSYIYTHKRFKIEGAKP